MPEPVSLYLDFHDTGQTSETEATEQLRDTVDLTPAGTIKRFDLRRPIYTQTSAYGHFGRDPDLFPWERVNEGSLAP